MTEHQTTTKQQRGGGKPQQQNLDEIYDRFQAHVKRHIPVHFLNIFNRQTRLNGYPAIDMMKKIPSQFEKYFIPGNSERASQLTGLASLPQLYPKPTGGWKRRLKAPEEYMVVDLIQWCKDIPTEEDEFRSLSQYIQRIKREYKQKRQRQKMISEQVARILKPYIHRISETSGLYVTSDIPRQLLASRLFNSAQLSTRYYYNMPRPSVGAYLLSNQKYEEFINFYKTLTQGKSDGSSKEPAVGGGAKI